MKCLVVDLSRCNGCYNCQLACKDEHCDNDWRPIAAPQPETGQFWCKMNETERGRVPVVRVDYRPEFCGQCDDCKLLSMAPDCVYRDQTTGAIIIDPDKAKGRSDLVDACPSHLVYWNDELDLPQKCTGCAHLMQNGWTQPRCVEACATGALQYGEEDEFAEEIESAVHLFDQGEKSHVFYLNVPKRFVAGTVANREENEVVIGAKVEFRNEQGETVNSTETDEFGDFRWDEADEALYQVVVAAEGYDPVTLNADCRDEDVVFDDLLIDQQ